MKKIILSVSIALIASATLSSCSSEPDSSKRYFLESGDTIVACVEFSRPTRMKFDVIDLTFSLSSIQSIKIQNDSVFAVGDEAYDKYGAKVSEAPLTFVATFNKDGIVNTDQLMAFVNANDSTDAVITKVTIK